MVWTRGLPTLRAQFYRRSVTGTSLEKRHCPRGPSDDPEEGRRTRRRSHRTCWVGLPFVAVGLGAAAWVAQRSTLDPAYGHLVFGLSAAAMANLLGAAAGTWLPHPLRWRDDTLNGIAVGKGLEAAVVVGIILAPPPAAGVRVEALDLRGGRLDPGLGIGLGSFALFALAAFRQAASRNRREGPPSPPPERASARPIGR